jgi:hypothetical protein
VRVVAWACREASQATTSSAEMSHEACSKVSYIFLFPAVLAGSPALGTEVLKRARDCTVTQQDLPGVGSSEGTS